MLLAGEGGWRAWPDLYPLTFAGVSWVRLRADCRVERRLSDLESARRARSGGGLKNGARAILGPSARAATAIRNGSRRMPSILSAVAAKSDITLSELRERLKERGVPRHRHTLAVLQASQDHAQKKSAHAAEQRRSAVNAAREAWFEGQIDLDPTQIIFIDETAANTKMARLLVARPEASDAAPPCLMATGKPPPSQPRCVTTALLRPWSSTAR